MYVRSENAEAVAAALRCYCRTHGTRFRRHAKYRLNGVKQVLRLLGTHKKQRHFFLSLPTDGWICIWEKVDHSDFADPGITRYLSAEMDTQALWVDLDDSYNVWAFQLFEKGKVIDEVFRPECCFIGKAEEDYSDLDAYPWCTDVAVKFSKTMKLPYFLELSPGGRKWKRPSSIIKVRARIGETGPVGDQA